MLIRASVIATACVASSAAANTVDAQFIGTNRGTNAQLSLNGGNINAFVGQLRYNFTNGTGTGAALSGNYITFCAELTEFTSGSSLTYQVGGVDTVPDNTPMGMTAAGAISDIYAAAGGAQLASNAAHALATAFQLAIWEIIYDYDGTAGSLNTMAGDFEIVDLNNTYQTAINTHLTNLFAAVGGGASGTGLFGLSHASHQDQIVLVPLPGPAMLAAAGLGGIVFVRRRMGRTV